MSDTTTEHACREIVVNFSRPKRLRYGLAIPGRRRLMHMLQVLGVFAILIALWQGVSPLWSVSVRQVVADPWSVCRYLVNNAGSSLSNVRVTGMEAVVGYAVGNALGFVLGISCHVLRRAGKAVFPFLVVAQAVPVITLSSIVILWFGNGLGARAALAGYLCFFPMTLNVYRGLESIDPHALKVARAFGASFLFELIEVKLPYIVPSIFVALRAGVVLAMSGAIVGELFGANAGLGAMLLSGLYYQTATLVWSSILLAGILSLICFAIIGTAQRRLAWW